MDRHHAGEADGKCKHRSQARSLLPLPSLENTIVTPLSYKTLAIGPRSKFIVEKPSTASAIYLREEGFMPILETPVHTGRTLPPFFYCLGSMVEEVMPDLTSDQAS